MPPPSVSQINLRNNTIDTATLLLRSRNSDPAICYFIPFPISFSFTPITKPNLIKASQNELLQILLIINKQRPTAESRKPSSGIN